MTTLEQYELNRPLTTKETQQLQAYHARLVEYDRLHEPLDEIRERWHNRQQQASTQDRAMDLGLLSIYQRSVAVLSSLIGQPDVDQQELTRRLAESEAEVQRLTDRLQGSTPDERAQVAELERQVYRKLLSETEVSDLKQLEAREARPEQLREFADGLRADCLAEVSRHDAGHPIAQMLRGKGNYEKYNLPARKARYEEGKQGRVILPAWLQDYAGKAMALVNQDLDELESIAAQWWAGDSEMAREWVKVMREALTEFEHYVAQDLSKSPTKSGVPVAEHEAWARLIKPGSSFSLSDLDRLLVSTGLLEDAASQTATADFKGAALVGIVKALRERNYLKRNDNAKLAALLAKRYGRDVANPNTIGRNYENLPPAAQQPYSRALAFLPAG